MKLLGRCKLILVPLLALILTNCTDKGKFSLSSKVDNSSNANGGVSDKAKNKSKATTKTYPAYTQYTQANIFKSFDIRKEITEIDGGNFSSPAMMLISFQGSATPELGYKLCLADALIDGKTPDNCFYSLAGKNIGYGLCMAAGRSQAECSPALDGTANTGFGICMSNTNNSYSQCKEALGSSKIGFGACMAQSVSSGAFSKTDCYDALDHASDNIGYGLCIAAGHGYSICSEALGSENTGYGVCMAAFSSSTVSSSSTASDNCYQALHTYNQSENLGFGLCMANFDNDLDTCKYSLGFENVGFGLCTASGRNYYDFWKGEYFCDQATVGENVGFGICVASGRSLSQCDDLVVSDKYADNIGTGLCLSNLNNYESNCDYAMGHDSTGFGICMAEKGNSYFSDCKKAVSSTNTNVGYGLCMVHRFNYECSASLNNNNEDNIGFGLCMSNTANSSTKCQDSLYGGNNIGYGVCMEIYKDNGRCGALLDYHSVGYAACIANPSAANSTYLTGDKNKENKCYTASDNYSVFTLDKGSGAFELGGSYLPTNVNESTNSKLELELGVPYYDVGEYADQFTVVKYTNVYGHTQWFQKNGNNWYSWNGTFQDLYPDHAYDDPVPYVLKEFDKIPVFKGQLYGLRGTLEFFWGYRLAGAAIHEVEYNADRSYMLKVN